MVNKIAIAQGLGITLAIFHIITHSWLFNDIEDKSGSNRGLVGIALFINIGILIMISVKMAKAKGYKFKVPTLGKKTAGVPEMKFN
tara:strand:+ start:407 stop:664 length:258 start_codon:yes stop_codon:yes gene_type:complete